MKSNKTIDDVFNRSPLVVSRRAWNAMYMICQREFKLTYRETELVSHNSAWGYDDGHLR